MGTFLSTGIVIEMITLKEELKKAEIKNEELFSALEEKFHYNFIVFCKHHLYCQFLKLILLALILKSHKVF